MTTRLGGVVKMRAIVITMISAPVTVSQPSFKKKCSKVGPRRMQSFTILRSFCIFCTFLNVLHNFKHCAQLYTFCTALQILLNFALFPQFCKYCTFLHILHHFVHFGIFFGCFAHLCTFFTILHVLQSFHIFAQFCTNLHIFYILHDFAHFAQF